VELKEEKRVLSEMIDLCQELGFGPLTTACESLYAELQEADSIEQLLSLSSELLIYTEELPFRDNDSQEILSEIAELNIKLQEMAE
jgi:hypothetical protein